MLSLILGAAAAEKEIFSVREGVLTRVKVGGRVIKFFFEFEDRVKVDPITGEGGSPNVSIQ